MSRREPTTGDNRARWLSRIGWGLASLGGLAGLITVVIFTRFYLSSAYPDLRLTPDLFTLEILKTHVGGFSSLVLLAAGFLLSDVLALVAAVNVSSRLSGAAVLVLGLILVAMSIVGIFSVGGYTIYAAMAVSAGGILLVLGSSLR